jgi:hypothetical protein
VNSGWRIGGVTAAGLALFGLSPAIVCSAAEDQAVMGQRMYRDGVLPSGSPLLGKLANGAMLQGPDAACVKCHRRSGLGGSEGRIAVRPISGRLLFEAPALPDTRHPTSPYATVVETRPPYTPATLARALREGVNSAGKSLDALMPRFALSDGEVAALTAYLKTLSATADPGVTATEIHFATIVTADAAPQKRTAMLDMMQAFFRDKNARTRQENRRRNLGSEQMYRNYRAWNLHVWTLAGPPESWRGQLEAYYRQQPVFAVIGGVGGGEWRPVHDFCEEQALPCVFPEVDFPVVSGAGHYSIYFSQGVMLEAEALARYLADQAPHQPASIVQVYRDDDLGRMPAQAMRRALQRHGIKGLVDRPVSGSSPPSGAFWARLLREDHPDQLVIWLNGEDSKELAGNENSHEPLAGVYFSASLLAMETPPLPVSWLARTRLIYPFALPAGREKNLRQMRVWLGARKIPLVDERVQGDTYFTLTTVGDVVSHLLGIFSRDYFIEGIERMAEITSFFSVYPRLSLGPDQRFASKGSYVVGFAGDEARTLQPLSDWIIP